MRRVRSLAARWKNWVFTDPQDQADVLRRQAAQLRSKQRMLDHPEERERAAKRLLLTQPIVYRPIIAGGEYYPSLKAAAEKYGIRSSSVHARLNNPRYSDWHYVEEQQHAA